MYICMYVCMDGWMDVYILYIYIHNTSIRFCLSAMLEHHSKGEKIHGSEHSNVTKTAVKNV